MILRASFALLSVAIALVKAEWGGSRSCDRVSFGRVILAHRDATANLDVSEWSTTDSIQHDPQKLQHPTDQLVWMASTTVRTETWPRKDQRQMEKYDWIDHDVNQGITQPLVKTSIWTRLTGRELECPIAVQNLVQSGLAITKHHNNEWIHWKPTDKITEQAEIDETSKEKHLAEGEILCYVGRCKYEQDEYYGGKLPIIKTISVIPMTPRDIADLMLDSSKVQTYNKMSLGRTDMKHIEGVVGQSKIVRNLTKPPMGEEMLSTTFIHARELDNGSFLVVSRAVALPDDHGETKYGKTEILLGVNLMVPHSDSSSRVTSVTHVYSPAIPGLLATTVGVKSAINFVKDLRNFVQPRVTS